MSLRDDARTTVPPGPLVADELGLPELLAGRYQILEQIGEGGMGVVCRGFDLDLEEIVAVKFLRADLADDDTLRTRFRREVKLARRVTHPNVARVFEFGRDGPLCFLTMEFVPGESLQALLGRAGPLPSAEVRALAVGLCEALAAAHDADVVHGDIKPGNILVAPGRGAVLTDFGIAQALGDRRNDEGTSGTPFYMAPEQARGEPVTPQTDVYAVGVVLFEALTGASPWPDDDALGQLAYKRRGAEPTLAKVAPELAPAWQQLISACLHGDPRQRPDDAHALLARLAPLDGFAAFPARNEPPPTPAPAVAGPRWLEVRPASSTAPELAWITTDLIAALAQIRGLRVRSAGPHQPDEPRTRVVTRVEYTARRAGDDVTVDVRVTADTDDTDNLHSSETAKPPRAVFTVHQPRAALHRLGPELAARVAASLDQSPAPPRRDLLDAEVSELYVHARHAYSTLHYDRAIELYEAALARAPGNPMISVGLTIARIQAGFLFREAQPPQVAELHALAEAAVREHGELGESHLARARVAIALGDAAGAARSLCDAVARAPSLVEAYVLLADTLLDIGRVPDAARRLDIALALDRSHAYAWTCRARQLAYQDRWDELYILVTRTLPELGVRSVILPRLLLWRPRQDVLESLELFLAGNRDDLPRAMWQAAQSVVAFALHREDRRVLLDRMDARFQPSTHVRRNSFIKQIHCELACVVGDSARALDFLHAADRYLLTDWQWIERCPLLAILRGEPGFATVREHVRVRADAIADAIWG